MEFITSELKKDDLTVEKVIKELKLLLLDSEGFCYIILSTAKNCAFYQQSRSTYLYTVRHLLV